MLHGRARHEREDSVTLSILQDRLSHLNRCKALEPTPELKSGAEKLVHIGLGSKMRLKGTYEPLATGAGGHGTHMASVTRDWPIFQHLLPEIAFAGHSNSGKSTLVNALIGVSPRLGPANVSDRAGWTDAISFYQVRPFTAHKELCLNMLPHIAREAAPYCQCCRFPRLRPCRRQQSGEAHVDAHDRRVPRRSNDSFQMLRSH